jgi:hypothetical protein
MENRRYWVGTCPLCQQGRLILQRNDKTLKLYAHCEECEEGYREPADIDAGKGFLTLAEIYETSDPDRTQIMISPWWDRVRGVVQ